VCVPVFVNPSVLGARVCVRERYACVHVCECVCKCVCVRVCV